MIDEGEEQSITITDFAPADEAAVLAFCRQIFDEEGLANRLPGSHNRREFRSLSRSVPAGQTARSDHRLWRPERALFRRRALDPLFVASSHRGSKLAARLFDALFERARALGYSTIVLDVNQENARAIRFYEKQGMEAFIPVPHPRWLESAPEERQYARYFRKSVNGG